MINPKFIRIKYREFVEDGVRYNKFIVNPEIMEWAEYTLLLDKIRCHRLISGLFIDLTDEESTMLYLKWSNRHEQ